MIVFFILPWEMKTYLLEEAALLELPEELLRLTELPLELLLPE